MLAWRTFLLSLKIIWEPSRWKVPFSWQEGRSWRGYEVFVMGLNLHAHLETLSLGLKDRDPAWPSPASSVLHPVPLLSITCPITLTDFISTHVLDIPSSGTFHRLLPLPCLPSSLAPFTWLKPPNHLALCFFVIFSVMYLLDMPLIGSEGPLGASLHSIGWFVAKWAFVCVGF